MTLLDIAILFGVLLAAGVSVHLVQAYWPHMRRKAHNDVAGFIYAAVGALYAVLLAFMVIAGWEHLNAARDTTYSEANALDNIYWISGSLPSLEGGAIDDLTLKYARTVIDEEWPMMARHQISPTAVDLVNQIRYAVFTFTPASAQQQVLYEQAVVSVNDFTVARQDRLNAISDVMPPPLWMALIIGAVITVGFSLLFGLENKIAHIGMVVALAALITIALLLIKNMDNPFAGVVRIRPVAFEDFLDLMAPRADPRGVPAGHRPDFADRRQPYCGASLTRFYWRGCGTQAAPAASMPHPCGQDCTHVPGRSR
jgi:hypothetical protein